MLYYIILFLISNVSFAHVIFWCVIFRKTKQNNNNQVAVKNSYINLVLYTI